MSTAVLLCTPVEEVFHFTLAAGISGCKLASDVDCRLIGDGVGGGGELTSAVVFCCALAVDGSMLIAGFPKEKVPLFNLWDLLKVHKSLILAKSAIQLTMLHASRVPDFTINFLVLK